MASTGHLGDRIVEQFQRTFVHRVVGHRDLAGVLINHIAPQTLQESHAAHHIAGVPWT